MWDLLRIRKKLDECGRLRDALESAADTPALSRAQQEHLAACPQCQVVADDIVMSRALLREVPARAALPGPWFAPRVMAESLEAWAAVPRLAARLTWLSALALLLASTWLYQQPKFTPRSGNETVAESLFDSPQSSSSQDDAVLPQERAQ